MITIQSCRLCLQGLLVSHVCDILNTLLLPQEHIITAIRQVGPSEGVPALGTVAGGTIV